jgi:hypothetical protein
MCMTAVQLYQTYLKHVHVRHCTAVIGSNVLTGAPFEVDGRRKATLTFNMMAPANNVSQLPRPPAGPGQHHQPCADAGRVDKAGTARPRLLEVLHHHPTAAQRARGHGAPPIAACGGPTNLDCRPCRTRGHRRPVVGYSTGRCTRAVHQRRGTRTRDQRGRGWGGR